MKKIISIILAVITVLGMCTACFAANASPSKTPVEIVPQSYKDKDGNELSYPAVIVDVKNKNLKKEELVMGLEDWQIIVTLDAEKNDVSLKTDDPAIQQSIVASLNNAEEIAADFAKSETLIAQLDALAKSKYGSQYDHNLYIPRDILDITLVNITLEQLFRKSCYAKLLFDLHLGADELKPVVAMRKVVNGKEQWQLIDDDLVVRNNDGTLSVYLDSVGPLVFLNPAFAETHQGHCGNGCCCPRWCPFCFFLCRDFGHGWKCYCKYAYLLVIILIHLCIWIIKHEEKKEEEKAEKKERQEERRKELERKRAEAEAAEGVVVAGEDDSPANIEENSNEETSDASMEEQKPAEEKHWWE